MIFFCSLGFFLLLLFGYSMTASNRRCLPLEEGGSFCFTQPDPPMALSWSSAMQWCKSINATLPILNTSYHYSVYQDALSYFELQAETLWLGANATYDPNNWYWIDGSRFTGRLFVTSKMYAVSLIFYSSQQALASSFKRSLNGSVGSFHSSVSVAVYLFIQHHTRHSSSYAI